MRPNRWTLMAVAAAFALLLSGCVDPMSPASADGGMDALALIDPALRGPYDVVRKEYDFGVILADDPQVPPDTPRPLKYTYPVQLTGNVHYPATGDGPFPVLAFMHGRHGTCAVLGFEGSFTHVCPSAPPVIEPVRSYAGYDYLGENLASHGYVVFSINANQVNDRDITGDRGAEARAQTIVGTLDAVARINEEPDIGAIGGDLVGRMDMTRIGIMGHSRGGEGVARAVLYNQQRTDGTPHRIVAVMGLAPTNYNHHRVPNVVYGTILPYCDGDVFDLMGAQTFDDSRYLEETTPLPKMTILALGANHNFYNTFWTSDDAGAEDPAPGGGRNDPYCAAVGQPNHATSGRMNPEDQRRHGLVIMAAFFRAYVGDESTFTPYFTGAADFPESACPAAEIPCPTRFHVSYHPGAPNRLVIDDFDDDASLAGNDVGGKSQFDGFSDASICAPADCPSQWNYHHANQLTLAWDDRAKMVTELGGADVSGYDVLGFRMGVNHQDPRNERNVSQDFRIELEDTNGNTFDVHGLDISRATFYPPGDTGRRVVLNQVRLDLSTVEGVDLTSLESVSLHFEPGTDGSIQVADLMFQRA